MRKFLAVLALAAFSASGCGIFTHETQAALTDHANELAVVAGDKLTDYITNALLSWGRNHPDVQASDVTSALQVLTAAVHEADPAAPKSRAMPEKPDAETVHAMQRLLKR